MKKLAALLANELLSEDKDITQKDKRVFCNGFFGCSNGKKRSNSMNLNPLDYPVDAPEPETKTDFRKRLFCNTGGCFGRRKRSTSQTLERRLNNRGSKDVWTFSFVCYLWNKIQNKETVDFYFIITKSYSYFLLSQLFLLNAYICLQFYIYARHAWTFSRFVCISV